MEFSPPLVIFALRFVSRDVAQPGSALRSGRRGRWFESSHPDFALQSPTCRQAGLASEGFLLYILSKSSYVGLRRTKPDFALQSPACRQAGLASEGFLLSTKYEIRGTKSIKRKGSDRKECSFGSLNFIKKGRCPRLRTAVCLLPSAYCLLPTAYCRLPAAYCRLPADSDFSVPPPTVNFAP